MAHSGGPAARYSDGDSTGNVEGITTGHVDAANGRVDGLDKIAPARQRFQADCGFMPLIAKEWSCRVRWPVFACSSSPASWPGPGRARCWPISAPTSIKVERSKTGDDTRGWGPPFIEGKDGGHLGAAYFHSTNRGKRSIEFDFESEDGKRIVRKLAARSDVLIENFKVGGLAKFGLDYKSLAPECPRLIYCSVTGFGQDGPYATRAGYDLMAQGMGGFMEPHRHRRRRADRAPACRCRTSSPASIR